MGAKHSKGKKDNLGNESQIDCVDKNSTLPASAKVGGLHKEEEVASPGLSKSGTLPANLSHSTSFSKRFRNSCRSWAKENGLVKEKKGAENGSIENSKEEVKENGVVNVKENGNNVESLPDEISEIKEETKEVEVEEKEMKKANTKVVQMRARAKFFEEMYNTPEKPKRADINSDSGMVTSTPIQPLGKVEALVKQVEEIESRNNSLDYEVNINDSIEQESDKISDLIEPNNEQKQDVEISKEEDKMSASVISQVEKVNDSQPMEQDNTAPVVDHEELDNTKDETDVKYEPNSSSLIVEMSELKIRDEPNKLEEVDNQSLEDGEKLSKEDNINEDTVEHPSIAETNSKSINLIVEQTSDKITENLEMVNSIKEEFSIEEHEIDEHEKNEQQTETVSEDQVAKIECDIEPVTNSIDISSVESVKEEIVETKQDDIIEYPKLEEPVLKKEEILPAKEEQINESSKKDTSLIKSDISIEDIQSEKGSEGYVSNDDEDSERKEAIAKVVPSETVTETVRSEELETNTIQ